MKRPGEPPSNLPDDKAGQRLREFEAARYSPEELAKLDAVEMPSAETPAQTEIAVKKPAKSAKKTARAKTARKKLAGKSAKTRKKG